MTMQFLIWTGLCRVRSLCEHILRTVKAAYVHINHIHILHSRFNCKYLMIPWQCSHASVGLAQAHPNYAPIKFLHGEFNFKYEHWGL